MAKFFEADIEVKNILGQTVVKKGVLHFSMQPNHACIAEDVHKKNYENAYNEYLESKKIPPLFPPPTDKVAVKAMPLARAIKNKILGE